MAPADARQLSKTFLLRLRALGEGTDEYQYVRNTLIGMNLSLVRYAARRFTRRGQPVDDILQVGTIGLIKAIDRWRPSRNVEFTTLAVPCIQGEIKRFFRDTTWAVRVPRRLQEMRIEIARAREQLEADGVQEPSAAQLAGRIGADEGEVTEGLVACNGYDSDSLDRPLQAGGWAFPKCMSPACWPACAAACANNFSPRRSGNSAGDTSVRGPAVSSTGLPHTGVGVADGVCT
ncbi:sigma-70 family RNA polymerase sigma factor [Streptomyces lydicus]|uniref:sigma-70 family RNA polymerase sigma factor n=1 Tax=Streptomyces lydicus TaxID=47763 RepID=UPI0037A34438